MKLLSINVWIFDKIENLFLKNTIKCIHKGGQGKKIDENVVFELTNLVFYYWSNNAEAVKEKKGKN